jgi:hypothetical protein
MNEIQTPKNSKSGGELPESIQFTRFKSTSKAADQAITGKTNPTLSQWA